MSGVDRVRGINQRIELISSELDCLRLENQQLYRLILQLVLDLNDLEDSLGETSCRGRLRPGTF
jgi:hypothetical protein